MPFITTHSLTLHYKLQGDPDGLPLIFLHGSFATSRWWQPVLDLLPEAIYAIVLDLRGCGQSDKPASGYTIETYAADLADFIAALGLIDFGIVAHSSAGAVAIEYLLAHPERASSLILVDPVPAEGVFSPVETLVLLEQMKHDRTLLTQAIASLMPTLTDDVFIASLVDDSQQMAPAAFTGIAESLGRWNRFADVRGLRLPTLLIWGTLDEIVTRDAMTRTLIAIPGAANLEVLHNCGHSPMIEAPLALTERIIEFITQDFGSFEGIRRSVGQ